MQKLARAVIGTNNMDNCSRYCQAPATVGLFRTVGYGGDSGSIEDIEKADLVLIVGSNTAECHPVIATRVKRLAQTSTAKKLIVSDLREHEMARRADLFLHPKPGTDLAWFSAVSRYLLDNGLADTKFLDQWVHGLEEYPKEPGAVHDGSCRLASLGFREDTLKNVAHNDRRGEAESAFCGPWASRSTAWAPTPRPPFPIFCSSPAITCGPARAPIRCADTITFRAPAITVRCRTLSWLPIS